MPAQSPIPGYISTAHAATWVGIPTSEMGWQAEGGWDAIAAAADNPDLDYYEAAQLDITYAELVSTREGSSAAWEAFAEETTESYVGIGTVEDVAHQLGIELPWMVQAAIRWAVEE